MVRKDFLIREDQEDFLSMLPGEFSTHMRQALDDYIDKKKRQMLNVSESKSPKGGVDNG